MAVTVERVSVAGSWWRQTPHGSDPLWLASPPSSGRWQRGETVAAIYLADDEDTAWAEWYRALAEIATPEKLARLELPALRPSRRTWAPFQEAGEQLHSDGYGGILYPSAARPDHKALCLFREDVLIPGAEPYGRP